MSTEITLPEPEPSSESPEPRSVALALAVMACPCEPWRIGERVLLRAVGEIWIGRGTVQTAGPAKAIFVQARPNEHLPQAPLKSESISRYQLRINSSGDQCHVENVGRCVMYYNGHAATECIAKPGDTLRIGNQLLLLAHHWFDGIPHVVGDFAFGAPDPDGIVGESSAAWWLRYRIAFAAERSCHVLVHGASGSGKELVAQAIHARSTRGTRPMIARNGATLPEGLIDAELFGHAKNYPNAGMPGSPGLIGDASGSTLFLDEFAELPTAAQAHLLRVLDAGEYHRLGETRARLADIRLIAATNRSLDSIRHDVRARFPVTIEVPNLSERREDIPLLLRHLLTQEARRGDPMATKCFPRADLSAQPELPMLFVERLLRDDVEGNVRGLRAALWRELREPGLPGVSESTARVWSHPSYAPEQEDAHASAGGTGQDGLSPLALQEALDSNNGSVELTWRALGLRNRFVLRRLIKKHGLELRKRSEPRRARTLHDDR